MVKWVGTYLSQYHFLKYSALYIEVEENGYKKPFAKS